VQTKGNTELVVRVVVCDLRLMSALNGIDEFDLGQLIGRGGFAQVYRSIHRPTNTQYAVKIIRKYCNDESVSHVSGGDSESLKVAAEQRQAQHWQRVENEIQIHLQLHHPNIVECFQYFEDSQHIYLILEYCEGENLFRYWKRRGRLGEAEAVRVTAQLLRGLDYLHSRGVIHRDLKLSNILLVPTDNANEDIHDISNTNEHQRQQQQQDEKISQLTETVCSSSSNNNNNSGAQTPSRQRGSSQPLHYSPPKTLQQSPSWSPVRHPHSPRPPLTTTLSILSPPKQARTEEDNDINTKRQNYTVKLCDFGLATQLGHPDEEHYTLCGTPNYIAPEIVSQQAHTFSADLWSLGCLFYTLVVG
jgi:serine/threonine protein kinase